MGSVFKQKMNLFCQFKASNYIHQNEKMVNGVRNECKKVKFEQMSVSLGHAQST